jgi:hypothetical protein
LFRSKPRPPVPAGPLIWVTGKMGEGFAAPQ